MSSTNVMIFCDACGCLIGVMPGATERSAPSMAIECVACWSRRPLCRSRISGSTAWSQEAPPKLRLKFPESAEPMSPLKFAGPERLRPAPALDIGDFAPKPRRMPTWREYMQAFLGRDSGGGQ